MGGPQSWFGLCGEENDLVPEGFRTRIVQRSVIAAPASSCKLDCWKSVVE